MIVTLESHQKARDLAQDILSRIPGAADRLAYAKRWAETFGQVPALQAEAEAFREAAEVMEIFSEKP